MDDETTEKKPLSPEELNELAFIALRRMNLHPERGIPLLPLGEKLLARKLSDPPTPEEVKAILESLGPNFFYELMEHRLGAISRRYYPATSKAIKNIILHRFPDAKPNEYRAEWRDNFPEFELQPNWVASRLLWMVEYLNTIKFDCSGITPGYWMGWIIGILEGRGWIFPGELSTAQEADRSMGRDE